MISQLLLRVVELLLEAVALGGRRAKLPLNIGLFVRRAILFSLKLVLEGFQLSLGIVGGVFDRL